MSKWIVGGYLRLSNDDNVVEESNSIVNQRDILNQFLKEQKDMKLYKFYVDDGYTGTDFNRPGFQELMADIQSFKINMIIVKDVTKEEIFRVIKKLYNCKFFERLDKMGF